MTEPKQKAVKSTLFEGDCLEVLKNFEPASVDAIVTDPPYELGLMGKEWDRSGIAYNVDLWRECLQVLKPGGHLLAFGGTRTSHRLTCAIEDAGFKIRDSIQWIYGGGMPKSKNLLKPSHEPITLARKPGSNSLKLNLDACRVEGGRWPANTIFDEDAASDLDAQSGVLTSGAYRGKRNKDKFRNVFGSFRGTKEEHPHGSSRGGASRFFYCARASKKERGENNIHPTVKPLDLMCYLVRLVTSAGGIVLDPFAGSGTTGLACKTEGFHFIGVEKNKMFFDIAKRRLGVDGVTASMEQVD